MLGHIVTVAVAAILALGASVSSSRAELQMQSSMDHWCKPAKVTGHTILRWKAPESCQNDCFTWRLTCSSGKHVTLQSLINPTTTKGQWTFHSWAPWSITVYVVAIVGYAAIALVGTEMLLLQLVLNGVLVSYAGYAAWAWYAGVTGNPWGASAEFDRLIVLNGYVYAAIMAVFFIVNMPAVRRGLEYFFFRYTVEPGGLPVLWPRHPAHAQALRAALTPHLHEFIDPRETIDHYRRETDKARALREKLDAYTAFIRAVVKRERMRVNFDTER